MQPFSVSALDEWSTLRASETDNLVLAHLRKIRATLAEHSARFAQIDKRFDEVEKRFDETRLLLGDTIGLSNISYLKSHEIDQRHEIGEGEQPRMRDRMDEFDRRLTKVEGRRSAAEGRRELHT